MSLISINEKQEVLKIIRNDVGIAYWTSNSTNNFGFWRNCLELKVTIVEGQIDLFRHEILCSSERNSICFRQNILKSEIDLINKDVKEDFDYDCNDCEL